MKVLVAMSGGIDSSVSALLLREQGHEVVGVFMRHGAKPEGPSRPGRQGCCSVEDAWDARRVADHLGIDFYALNFEQEFGRIIEYFVAEYDRGATPNPCIRCNRDLKFGRLFDVADSVGAEKVATGHYARVEDRGGRPALRRGLDPDKDQSYVLFPLTRAQLGRCIFPVGGIPKPEVREIARRAGLRLADKPDSQEICFVPGGDHRELLRRRLGDRAREGEFVGTDGSVLGRHPGHQFFTIGQRRGLGIALGRPAYVVGIDPERNRVVLGSEEDLGTTEFEAEGINWIADAPPGTVRAQVQIRYNSAPEPATIEARSDGSALVRFEAAARAVTPGQAAVFYAGDEVIGGGWIRRSSGAPSPRPATS